VPQEKLSANAHAVWIKPDAAKADFVGAELPIRLPMGKTFQTIGRRGSLNDIVVDLDSISGSHCRIDYSPNKGWVISEKHKAGLSSNGTFFFVKSHT
jgi:hypothetical protein